MVPAILPLLFFVNTKLFLPLGTFQVAALF